MTRYLLAALPLLAACAQDRADTPPPAAAQAPVPGTRCDANAAQQFVGQPADAVVAEAQRLSGAQMVRRYTTGDMLTRDYRVERLNVEVDAGGKVVKIYCG
jgi:hypothetical protein